MKKRKNLIIVGIVLFFIIFTVVTTVIASNDMRSRQVEKRVTKVYKEEETITCYRENGHDGASETEEIYLQNGELVTKKNTASWTKAEPKEKTCEHYTQKSEGLNGKAGVTSSVSCDETRGNFSATYILSEIDKKDMKIKQFDFVDSQNKFDSQAWIIYMEKDNYECERS